MQIVSPGKIAKNVKGRPPFGAVLVGISENAKKGEIFIAFPFKNRYNNLVLPKMTGGEGMTGKLLQRGGVSMPGAPLDGQRYRGLFAAYHKSM